MRPATLAGRKDASWSANLCCNQRNSVKLFPGEKNKRDPNIALSFNL